MYVKRNSPLNKIAAFSLVEVTLAMGIAAFCLIAMLGLLPIGLKTQQAGIQQTIANQIISQIFADLRADVRLPPGQTSHENASGFNLHGHWADVAAPDTLFFTQQGLQTGNTGNGTPPADAAFRATISYQVAPASTTSLATITVSWPASVDPSEGRVPAGSVTMLVAVNR